MTGPFAGGGGILRQAENALSIVPEFPIRADVPIEGDAFDPEFGDQQAIRTRGRVPPHLGHVK